MTAYPYSPYAPTEPALTLAPELPAAEIAEYVAAGDQVRVQPTFGRKPFFADVLEVNGERVIVQHSSFGYVSAHSIDDVTLILKASARDALFALQAQIDAEASKLPADWHRVAQLEAAWVALENEALEAARAASAR